MTSAGIEPATFRFVEQHLNHCATAVPFLDRQWRHYKQLQTFTLTQPSAKHELLILADQATNFSRQAEQGEGGRDVARLLHKLILSLKRLEPLFITSSAEHSTTYVHATCKLQPEHRVKENERSVKNTHYIFFPTDFAHVFRLVSTDSGYVFPSVPIHYRAPVQE